MLLFWSNPYKVEVMITSLIEVLDLPNFGHMTTSKIQFEARDKTLLVIPWAEIISHNSYFKILLF